MHIEAWVGCISFPRNTESELALQWTIWPTLSHWMPHNTQEQSILPIYVVIPILACDSGRGSYDVLPQIRTQLILNIHQLNTIHSKLNQIIYNWTEPRTTVRHCELCHDSDNTTLVMAHDHRSPDWWVLRTALLMAPPPLFCCPPGGSVANSHWAERWIACIAYCILYTTPTIHPSCRQFSAETWRLLADRVGGIKKRVVRGEGCVPGFNPPPTFTKSLLGYVQPQSRSRE